MDTHSLTRGEGITPSSLSRKGLARALGVSLRGLFRLLKAYEEVFGPLPRTGTLKVRSLPPEVLPRLRRALELSASWEGPGKPAYRMLLERVRLEEASRSDEQSPVLGELAAQVNALAARVDLLAERLTEVTTLSALVRELKEELAKGLREVAEIRLILHASLEGIAQEYAHLLSQPSLLRDGGKPSPLAPETPSPARERPEEREAKEAREGRKWWMRERTLL